ncbi:hypothetical protein [Aeromicrobium wangtongii]|uniref:Uncharacterized protein n=1 Tax=Aeromicrobium wangtongii TaxID=2969247 RepID=A0ABY5M7M0_9ACTN|nr:hypothetical protein [Aeromicrobium wangtongii]MCD9199800.1 hypothetical protein [Aeromicrobium wangtongii]UUP14150.1 hypothetical protein NQV15_02225 [Aeromicrobium wangtongii]
MPLAHTPASRSAGLATMLLALVQLFLALHGDHDTYIEALLLAQAAATAAGAAKLLRDNSVESRLGVGFLVVLSCLGALVPAILGLPGQDRTWGVLPAAVFSLAIVVIALLVADLPRRVTERRSRSPYAS